MRYTPVDHKDPVALSWIEFALAVPSGETDDVRRARAIAMRDQMLSSKKGVGGCVKCHAIDAASSANGDHTLAILWGYQELKNSPYLKFSHKSHLDVLEKGNACKTCHALNKDTNLELSDNKPDLKLLAGDFNSIHRKTCMQCHTKGKVRQDCQLCHLYHLEPGFKEKILLAKNHPRRF